MLSNNKAFSVAEKSTNLCLWLGANPNVNNVQQIGGAVR